MNSAFDSDFAAMGLPSDRGQNAFTAARKPSPGLEAEYPQKSYYWRRKAGLTGTRDNPDRHWRKRSEPCYFVTQGDADRAKLEAQG